MKNCSPIASPYLITRDQSVHDENEREQPRSQHRIVTYLYGVVGLHGHIDHVHSGRGGRRRVVHSLLLHQGILKIEMC